MNHWQLATIPIEEIYNYEPIPDELDGLHKYIIGARKCLDEYMKTNDHVEYMVFRIFALSEVVWAENKPSFSDFENKVKGMYQS